jgi:hypothetical protein
MLKMDREKQRYDAFISYRHGGLDSLVAEKLHHMLETYTIPRVIAKKIGKRKLTRVFRDREELPTSSNLSDSINDALENSAYLLLICSRRTCESLWVMQEVLRFGELHGKDKIIALLIDGEPDESFPPGLRERKVGNETIFVEPLAADIRAETWAGSLKLLKEEKLRLIAPILGCAFDDLRRRHRRRRIQRIATVISASFVFTLLFGAFSTYQYVQINRNMQLKLENQSYVLSEYSAAQLAAGDPDTAILLALSALPENFARPERPLVAEAETALSNALGVYDVTEGFKVHRAVNLPAAPGKVMLSPNETLAAALYPYEVALFDTESGELKAVLPALHSALAGAEFLSDDIIVYAGINGIEAYNLKLGEIIWQGSPASAIAVSEDKSVIAAVYKSEGRATLYAAAGRELGRVDFNGRSMRVPADDSFINPHDTLFALNSDGRKLAVSFSDGSLSVFDIPAGTEEVIWPPFVNLPAADSITMQSPDFIPVRGGAIHFAGGFYGNTLLFSVVENEPYYSALIVYDTTGGTAVERYESDAAHFIPHAGRYGLFAAFDNQLMAVDAETGAVFHAASAGGKIEAFSVKNGAFLIGESGGAYRFTADKRIFESSYAAHFLDLGRKYALTGSRDSNVMRILKETPSSGELIFLYDKTYGFSEAKINPALNRIAFYSYRGLRLYDFENIIAETEFPDPYLVLNTEYDGQSGNVAVMYQSAFRLYSGLDGSLMAEAEGKPGVQSVVYTNFGVSVLDENGTATLYDLSTGEASAAFQASASADYALALGYAQIESIDGIISFDGTSVKGELVGAAKTGENGYAFAVSDGVRGQVFSVNSTGQISERFTFEVRGGSEVYFCGGYVFVSPLHGDAFAYTLDGTFVRSFSYNGFKAEVFKAGDYIAASYVLSASERYTLLLRHDTLDAIAYLPGFLGEMGEEVILDNGEGLYGVRLRSTQELIELALERLGGRVLSPEERRIFKAD